MIITLHNVGNFSAVRRQCSGEVDDVALLAGARRGDAEAFAQLFARFQGPLYRYAAHMCGRDAADDVVQETFLAVLRGSGRYDASRGPVGNYLFGIARHCVLRRLGARDLTMFGDEREDALAEMHEQPSVLDALTQAETVAAVRAAIAALPPAYREVIVLCELQDMSYAEAAEVVRVPVGTVRSRLHRARALLMTKLSRQHLSGQHLSGQHCPAVVRR